jgi:uncharacterized membrane-anchored protein
VLAWGNSWRNGRTEGYVYGIAPGYHGLANEAAFRDLITVLSFANAKEPRQVSGLHLGRSCKSMNVTTQDIRGALSKVPEITLGFWIIKIAATTLGETGGDSVTMTFNWGYLAGTALFLGFLVVLVIAQILAKKFNPFLYWATIIASTTFGTTMADFADRSLGIGYTGGSVVLLACLLVALGVWHWSEGTISVNTVFTPRVECFYWAAITFSQTLGTALGDWMADTGLRYQGGALVFAAGLAIVGALYLWTNVSRVFLFWAAFILTRPFGATVGDFLDKPVSAGGLNFSRPLASAIIAAFIIVCLFVLPQRAGRHPGVAE